MSKNDISRSRDPGLPGAVRCRAPDRPLHSRRKSTEPNTDIFVFHNDNLHDPHPRRNALPRSRPRRRLCRRRRLHLRHGPETLDEFKLLPSNFNCGSPRARISQPGVVFVLNNKFLDTENIREHVLMPGRAFMIVVPWHKGESLNILNIYAPNRPEERDKMWADLWKKWADDP